MGNKETLFKVRQHHVSEQKVKYMGMFQLWQAPWGMDHKIYRIGRGIC